MPPKTKEEDSKTNDGSIPRKNISHTLGMFVEGPKASTSQVAPKEVSTEKMSLSTSMVTSMMTTPT
jgi:hypothetical protein